MRYALVKDGIVINAVEWDGETEYAPDGELVASDTAQIGDAYDGSVFTPPSDDGSNPLIA